MAAGGIHDQLGGGFHRYSTDRYWLVPHFEKMLYDNALLARVYLEAYQVTGETGIPRHGGRHAGLDAERDEGPRGGVLLGPGRGHSRRRGLLLHLDPRETEEVLGKENSAVYRRALRGRRRAATSRADGRSSTSPAPSRRPPPSSALDAEAVEGGRQRVEDEAPRGPEQEEPSRRRRQGPRLLERARDLGVRLRLPGHRGEEVPDAAAKAPTSSWRSSSVSGKLYRRYRDGEVAVEGTLEDYSFLVAGLLDLYEASFDAVYVGQRSGWRRRWSSSSGTPEAEGSS